MGDTSTNFEIDDPGGGARIAGVAGSPGAAADTVLTSDGSGGTSWASGGGSLPEGWTQDGDPANVTTHGVYEDSTGTITVGENDDFAMVTAAGFITSSTGGESVQVTTNGGVVSNPRETTAAFAAFGDAGATVALDAGALPVSNFSALNPTAPPVVPLTTPSVQDVIDALVTLGLITQSD